MIVLWMFPEAIVKIFNREPETIALGAEGLRFFMVFVFINIIAFPLEIIFTHNGWGKFPAGYGIDFNCNIRPGTYPAVDPIF